MNATQAAAVLAQLRAEHGDDVLAELLGAAWLIDETANHAAVVEEDGEEDAGDLEEWLFEAEIEAGDWLVSFLEKDAFHRGRGVPGF